MNQIIANDLVAPGLRKGSLYKERFNLAHEDVVVLARAAGKPQTSYTFAKSRSNYVQATIVPIYLMIISMRMYDSLAALMIPAIAFGLPLSILIISNSLRDVPKELFEAMDVDGSTEWQKMWRLAFPIVRPALITVAVYQTLMSWNGFLFPLILTQSPEQRTLPLALWSFQGEYATNVPVVMAAVVLSSIPIVLLYAFGRRYLVSGMTAGSGK